MEYNNPKIISFRDLIVWQKGLEIAKEVYRISASFPKDEIFGLTSQMRRSAVSISSNIAEGRGRSSKKDFANFLYIAQGSLYELETQLTLAKELYKIEAGDLFTKIEEEQKMLSSMIKKLTANS